MQACKEITDLLCKKTIFNAFTIPVDPVRDGLTDYDKIVTKPMDLGRITGRLAHNKYRNTAEWYQDVELVFQNALDYHPVGTNWYLIAEYGLYEFQRMAAGLNLTTEQEWFNAVSTVSTKLSTIVSHPPEAKKANRDISKLRQDAEAASPLAEDGFMKIAERLNDLVRDDSRRETVCEILRVEEGLDLAEATREPVDIERLKSVTVNMLKLYSESAASKNA
jgi:hypothetical protein